MNITEIKELLKGLITDKTSTEDVEKIVKVNSELDNLEKESNELIKSHEELRQKYIKSIQDFSFKGEPKKEENQPKSLEDCVQEQIDKRKEN